MTDTPPDPATRYVSFEQLERMLAHIDAIVNTHEQQLSYLLLMVSEMFVGLEAAFDELFADKSGDEIMAFRTKVTKGSADFLAGLTTAMKQGDVVADVEPDPAAPVEHVAGDEPTSC